MIQSMELFSGIKLRCCPDQRFKQGCLSIQLVRPMCAEEAGLNALLPAVLLRGCESAPDIRAITARLDTLYGASVSTLVRRIGDYQTTGLYARFIEDRFAMDGEQVLAPMAAFLGELLRRPVLEDGAFRKDHLESEKKNLVSVIESQRNDKRAYAMAQMLKAMCRADSFGIPRLGTKEQVEDIGGEALYSHYQRILRESPVEVFYVGSAPMEQVAALLRPVFSDIERAYRPLPPQTPFHSADGGSHTERMELAQGKLCMGFTTPITSRDPEFAAMWLLDNIFGAGMTSKLFMNIREKRSLCYDISSAYYGSKGIVTVFAGIDPENRELVTQQVLAQLEACRAGEITSQELDAAKASVLSGLRAVYDSPGAIESYFSTTAIGGLHNTPEKQMRAVEAVTKEQLVAAAKSLRLHITYFLEGVSA